MARSSGASPSLINNSLAIKGPRPLVDVTALGARGNGVADDRAALQLASDLIPSTGGIALLPGGPGDVYLVDSIGGTFSFTNNSGTVTKGYGLKLKSNITWLSRGATIRRGPNFPDTAFLVTSGDAALSNVVFEDVTFDQGVIDLTTNTARGSYLFYMRYGASSIRVLGSKFVNLGTGVMIEFGTDNTSEPGQSRDIQIVDTILERILPGPVLSGGIATPENVSNLRIWNASEVLLDRVKFRSGITGATAGSPSLAIYAGSSTACGSSSPMYDIKVSRCTWEAAQVSAFFVRGAASTVINDVIIDRNTYKNGGKWGEKGWLDLQNLGVASNLGIMNGAQVTNNVVRNFGYYGSSASGTADRNLAQAISIGNDLISNLVVTGNIIDGESAGIGESTSIFGQQIGILCVSANGAIVDNNITVNLGGPGIKVLGGGGVASVGGGQRRASVSKNIVTACCQKDDAGGLNSAGILIGDFVTNLGIHGNTATDCGSTTVAGQTAGIGFLPSDPAVSSSTSNVLVTGNTARDTRAGGSRTQKYGVRLGFFGGTITRNPTNVTVKDNDVSNNVTGGIYADTTYGTNTRNYDIRDNPGWMASGPVVSTMTAAIAAGSYNAQGPITVPGATVGDRVAVTIDGAALNVAMSITGLVSAADTVYAMIHNGSTGSQTPGAGNLRMFAEHRNRP